MQEIRHLVLIPFSYYRPGYNPKKTRDPLNPQLLRHRMKMLELITIPSLMAQKNQEFAVILIIDKRLHPDYRKRLETACSGLPEFYLHEFTPVVTANTLEWLQPYIPASTQYLITTKLDADDALFDGYLDYLRHRALDNAVAENPVSLQFIVAQNIVQWDFFHTKTAPCGYAKPWTRHLTKIISSGLSVLCKYPELDISPMGIAHWLIYYLFYPENISDMLSGKTLENINTYQAEVREKSLRLDYKWDGQLKPEFNLHWVKTPGFQVITTNHFGNVRMKRLFEQPNLRKPVVPGKTFDTFGVDYPGVEAYIQKFRRNIPTFINTIRNALKYNPAEANVNNFSSMLMNKRSVSRLVLKGFRKMK